MKLGLVVVFLVLGAQAHHGDPICQERERLERDLKPVDRSVDTVIVGAGPAGTYAAYKLRNSKEAIELIELTDHVGGRLDSLVRDDIPDVVLELGADRFIENHDERVEQLVKELNLQKEVMPDSFNSQEVKRFYLRGKLLSLEDIREGKVPFDLSPEERSHAGKLVQYYFEQLTGETNDSVLLDQVALYKMKTKDGRRLYNLTVAEALETVATPEGRDFIRGMTYNTELSKSKYRSIYLFQCDADVRVESNRYVTIKGGMQQLPIRLSEEFKKAKPSNKVTLNWKLESIVKPKDGNFHLTLVKTVTQDGVTTATRTVERVSASRVILALPHHALSVLDADILRTRRVRQALAGIEMVKKTRVYLAFHDEHNRPWWRNNTDGQRNNDSGVDPDLVCVPGGQNSSRALNVKTDTPIDKVIEYWRSEKSRVSILSLSSINYKAACLQRRNTESNPLNVSSPGANQVSKALNQELISHLSEIFDVDEDDIPEPVAAVSSQWNEYPYSGAYGKLKAGYNAIDVRRALMRPAMREELYVVGGDFNHVQQGRFLESALGSVEDTIINYL